MAERKPRCGAPVQNPLSPAVLQQVQDCMRTGRQLQALQLLLDGAERNLTAQPRRVGACREAICQAREIVTELQTIKLF